MQEADVIVLGAGLAGLVAIHELARAGCRVLVLDQENRNNLGGCIFSGRAAGRALARELGRSSAASHAVV